MFWLKFILFFLLANPAAYKLTRKAVGGIASPDGLPTQLGVLVHALVFVLLMRFLYRRFSRYIPTSMNPGLLEGTNYMSMQTRRFKKGM